MDWSLKRLQGAAIAPKEALYDVTPLCRSEAEIAEVRKSNPELFKFKAISVGDGHGQAFIVPLDESGRGTAELIIKALKAYRQTEEEHY